VHSGRGAEEERQAARRRWSAAFVGCAVASLALLALAVRSRGGHAHSSSLAAKVSKESQLHAKAKVSKGHVNRAAQVKLALHRATKLWTHDGENADSSTQRVAVTADDINNLGLRAPSGFNVPSVNVTGDDVSR